MRPRLSFEQFASDRLQAEHASVARAWAGAMPELLGADPHRSGADALDVEALDRAILRLAAYVADGDDASFARSDDVVIAMRALGDWCARHGNDARSTVCVFDVLAALLDGRCLQWSAAFAGEPRADEAVRVAGRLNRGPIMMAAESIAAYALAGADTPTRGDFSELLVHELSTPINAAEVAAVLLENENVTPGSRELRRLAGTIQRSLRRVRALIGDVRDLSAAHGADGSDERMVSIRQLLGDVMAELGGAARENGVRIDVEEPVPALRVRNARVGVVLRNLVSNAIKYSDPRAPTRWVRISFVPGADGRLTIAVSDNGLGIPRDQHDRVFQRFNRLHPERADGTGLGLAIALETAIHMNAGLDFDSEPGVGSTFRFTLPPQGAA